MSIQNDWLNAIRQDIEIKYAITNPTFVVDETMLDGKTFEEWIKLVVVPPYLWVKYKKLSNNSFEFKVKNSEYLRWLHEQSYEIYQDVKEFTHFVLMAEDVIIDIIDSWEPKLTHV